MEKNLKIIKAETCSEKESISNVAKIMKKKKTRRVFVLDGNKLAGIVTTSDIVSRVVAENKDASKLTAKDIMTKDVKFITTEENVEDALKIMDSTHSYVCPILKDNKFLGVLSYHNILFYLKKHLQ